MKPAVLHAGTYAGKGYPEPGQGPVSRYTTRGITRPNSTRTTCIVNKSDLIYKKDNLAAPNSERKTLALKIFNQQQKYIIPNQNLP